MIWIPRVASGRPWKVETGTPDCEFVGGELAQHDRAGGSQARHAYRVGRCDVVDQYLRMARRGQARDVDNIFDANRTPCNGPRRRPDTISASAALAASIAAAPS